MLLESALVALIPEVEGLVEPFRSRYDPAAAIGVPAHVTTLYPFKPPHDLTDEVMTTLRELLWALPGFAVSFSETRRFPGVLYLAPDPAEPFRLITEAIVRRFPDTPPYGGAFAEIIPHLTLAQIDDPKRLDEVAAAFQERAAGRLPIRANVEAIALMDNAGGPWRVSAQFSLSPAGQAAG